MSKARVEHHHGAYLVFGIGGGRKGVLVQTDWEYPRIACQLGWSLRRVQRDGFLTRVLKRAPNVGRGCFHNGTDGTVMCDACGVTASEFINAAQQFLDERASYP